MNNETILNKSYDFWKMLLPVLARLPKAYKFNLGDKTQDVASRIMELLIEAYYSPSERKRELLVHANIQIEILRRYLRLMFEIGLYPSTTYGRLSEMLNDIGRMTGGWLKSLKT